MVTKVSIWSTLEPLMYSEKLHLAEISKRLKRHHTTVRKQLAVFEKMGLVSKEKRGRQVFYTIKHTPLLVDYLTIIEKEKLVRKCQEDLLLKEIVGEMHKFANPILIFGSAVESSREAEDVDLLVAGEFDKKSLGQVEKRLNVKFHAIVVESLDEVGEALRQEIRKKHLIVNGSEALIRWLVG